MKKEEPRKVEFYHQLGAQIRRFRKERRLSQDELAKLVGLARTSLTNIEQGRQHPTLHTLCEIVECLKVEISELLPGPAAIHDPVDLKLFDGAHVRGDNELAFIENAITGKKITSAAKKKNSSYGRKASD
jgi:transcriptional regulator with XRE-family HTH domain